MSAFTSMPVKGLVIGASLGVALAAAAEQAADSSQDASTVATAKIEELIVTARKIKEKDQYVPVALDVLTAEEMRRQGFDTMSDMGTLLPGVTFDVGGFVQDTRPAMRGMQNERGRPSVAILIDNIDASSENLSIPGGSSMLYTRLLDVERLEVVKGPQTLLYGRNAFGGAINVVTRRPDFDWDSRLGVEYGNGNRRTLDAGISGPIIDDRLAFRASVAKHDFDGFYDNPNTGADVGTEDSLAGSLALLWTPSEIVSVYGRYQYSDESYSQPASALLTWDERLPVPDGSFSAGPPGSPQLPCPADLSTVPPQVFAACTRGVVTGEVFVDENDVDYSLDPATGQPFAGMSQTNQFGTLTVDIETEHGAWTYQGGFMENRSNDRSDTDYTDFAVTDPFAFSISTVNILDYTFQHQSHELRHAGTRGKLSWIAGGTVYLEEARLNNGSQFWLRNPDSFLAGPPFGVATEPNAGVNPTNPQSRDTEHYSAFFSLSYAINDQWTISGAGRYSIDNIDYTVPTWSRQQVSLLQQTPVDICPVDADDRDVPQSQRYPNVAFNCFVSDSVESNVFTPRVAVEYTPSETTLLYASITTGFKPGGFAANEAVSLEGQRYNPEEVTTYEIGGKSEWFDRRLRINGAIYQNDYRDQQIGIQQQPAGSISPIPGITNAARVDVFGVELQADWRINDKWLLTSGYAFTDATFGEYVLGAENSTTLNRTEAGNAEADFSGNRVGKNPRHAANVSVQFRSPLFATGYDVFSTATGIYRSRRFLDESNLAYLPSFGRLNLVLGVENDRYQIMAYVDNVLDDDSILNAQRVVDLGNNDGFAPGRGYLAHLPTPRMFGVRLQARFE